MLTCCLTRVGGVGQRNDILGVSFAPYGLGYDPLHRTVFATLYNFFSRRLYFSRIDLKTGVATILANYTTSVTDITGAVLDPFARMYYSLHTIPNSKYPPTLREHLGIEEVFSRSHVPQELHPLRDRTRDRQATMLCSAR